jgi:exopolysaccharide biosynthesis operon protein EpsL
MSPKTTVAALLLLLVAAPSAHAFGNDTFKLNASYGLLHDTNLFRLPENTNFQSTTGRSSGAESVGIATVGLAFSKAYSLQQFDVSVSLIDYRYRNFDYLSFTANNYKAAWLWSLTPRLRGIASSERAETLNSFADFQGVNQRNARTNVNTRFDGEYELDGTWRLLGGVSRASQTNEQRVVAGDDTRATTGNGGLRYVFPSGSSMSYVFNHTDGRYTKRDLSPLLLLDDRFTQQNHELRLNWLFSGKSTADLSAAYLDRSHPSFAQRDFSGLVVRTGLNWNWTEKTSLAASYSRELAAYQTNDSNYSQTHRVSLGPVWKITPKVTARLRHEFSTVDYRGRPFGLAASERVDKNNDSLVSLEWLPARSLLLSASLQHSRRSSNQNNLDFRSTQANVAAQLSY